MPRLRPNGPSLPGMLSEAELAARWGRAANTLSGWRTRPHASFTPIAHVVVSGCIYYENDVVRVYEQDPRNRTVLAPELRGLTLCPLPSSRVVQAELPLPSAGVAPEVVASELTEEQIAAQYAQVLGLTEAVPRERGWNWIDPSKSERRFKSIDIVAGYALAIATDDTAWYAEVLGGLSFASWKPVAALPQGDQVASIFARKAAA